MNEALSEFLVSTERRGSSTAVACSGELHASTCATLNEALAIALEDRPHRLIFDGRGVSLLTSPGIEILFRLVQDCKRRGVACELQLSPPVRRVLDLVGLWWLGVVDDGLEADDALGRALRAYARLAPQQRSGDNGTHRKGGGEYFLG